MPESIIYLRGFPPPLTEYQINFEPMVQDLKAIAGLGDDEVEALRHRLSETEGFLDPKTLLATIREVIGDE